MVEKNRTRFGIAKGKFIVPEPDPELDAEIARMFLGEDDPGQTEPGAIAPKSHDGDSDDRK